MNIEEMNVGDASYGNTASYDPDAVANQTDNVILAGFAYDVSPSMSHNMGVLNQGRNELIEAWKKSHHAPSIMYSEITFNESVNVEHNYLPINSIGALNSLSASGYGTSLFEAIMVVMKNATSYKRLLENSGIGSVKVMLYVFTDGQNNINTNSVSDIKDYLDEIRREDESNFTDFEIIVLSIDKSNNSYFQKISDECSGHGLKVLIQDKNDNRTISEFLRDNLNVVSKSVSSGSNAGLSNLTI